MVDFFKMRTGKTKEELVRPEIMALRARGAVTWEEWDVPMNSYERDELLPALTDEAFLRHFVYCAGQVGHSGPGSYNYAVSSTLAPEALKRGIGVAKADYLRSTKPRNPDAASRAEFLALYLRSMVRHAPLLVDSGYARWAELPESVKRQWSRFSTAVLSFTDRMAREEWGHRPPEHSDESAMLEVVDAARALTWKGYGTLGATDDIIEERGAKKPKVADRAVYWRGSVWDLVTDLKVLLTGKQLGELSEQLAVAARDRALQVRCPECEGETGFDPDDVPGAPVVCPTCEGLAWVSLSIAADFKAKRAEEAKLVGAFEFCGGCGGSRSVLPDEICRECGWRKSST